MGRWWEKYNPGVVVLPWLAPAATALWLKLRMLGCDAFRASAHSVRHSGQLTRWETAALFRWDLLVSFVLIPAVLVAVGSLLPRLGRVVWRCCSCPRRRRWCGTNPCWRR